MFVVIVAGLHGSVLSKHAASVTHTAVKLLGRAEQLPNNYLSVHTFAGSVTQLCGQEISRPYSTDMAEILMIYL